MADNLHRQDETWDKAMSALPAMYCGRLDMATWNAADGQRQKMVYFEGEDERVVCEGRRADFVAYAANRYQPLMQENERLRMENMDLLEIAMEHELIYRDANDDLRFTDTGGLVGEKAGGE